MQSIAQVTETRQDDDIQSHHQVSRTLPGYLEGDKLRLNFDMEKKRRIGAAVRAYMFP